MFCFSWGVEILGLYALTVLLLQGRFDPSALEVQRILIYLGVWTAWTIVGTLMVWSAWPPRAKSPPNGVAEPK
jgi:hypothetical protein